MQRNRLPETRVSDKGQTIIPRVIRRTLNIEPGTRLRWESRDSVIILYPVVKDPVAAAQGKLQGLGISMSDFLEQRQ